jgi:hypothetical protein
VHWSVTRAVTVEYTVCPQKTKPVTDWLILLICVHPKEPKPPVFTAGLFTNSQTAEATQASTTDKQHSVTLHATDLI